MATVARASKALPPREGFGCSYSIFTGDSSHPTYPVSIVNNFTTVLYDWSTPMERICEKAETLIGITNPTYQSNCHDPLREAGFKHVVTFKGSEGNPLFFWIRPRPEDQQSGMVNGYHKLTHRLTGNKAVLSAVKSYSFPSCCGASITRFAVGDHRPPAYKNRYPSQWLMVRDSSYGDGQVVGVSSLRSAVEIIQGIK